MKKIILLLCIAMPGVLAAQNLQLHYDFGKTESGEKRDLFVGTFEMFRPDTLGYTFIFTDFEFDSPGSPRGASLGYFEISRTFNLGWLGKSQVLQNLMLHAEYNDGLLIYPFSDTITGGLNLGNSWLGGIEYGFVLGDLSLNAMVLGKLTAGSSSPDIQFTLVWFYPLFQNKVTIAGYVDIWSQDDFMADDDQKIGVLYSEPQIWFNFNSHLAVGSEFKISKNFVPGSERLEVFPTLGIKWEF